MKDNQFGAARVLRNLGFVIVTMLMTSGASAGSLAEKKMWASAEEDFVKAKEGVKRDCGSDDITLTLDKKSFNTPEALKTISWCAEYLSAVGSLCGLSEMKDNKKDIMDGVKTITCSYDAKLKSGMANSYAHKFVKDGKKFKVFFNNTSANASDQFRDFLKNEL